MPDLAEYFLDEQGYLHEKREELGRGGQGIVFRTRDPDVAVKVPLNAGRPVDRQRYVDQLHRLRTLPLPPNLNLSMPAVILKDTAGYAMRLLNDMVPFTHFWPTSSELAAAEPTAIPAWLSGLPPNEAYKLLHYAQTGGLRRRLLALYKCSAILARLHAAGLVYGDVSPRNAYVSADRSSREVWLIDADNLRFETTGRGPGVFTPKFGAPELVRGLDGGRARTDCHAFAVMAFWMLTLIHPFIGDYVEEGKADWAEDDETDGDLDEKAYAGLLPWVDDEHDDRNTTECGFSRSLMLTDELMRLFQETFGPGRTTFWRRPAIFHWPRALARALDQTLACAECGMTSYDDPTEQPGRCPFCAAYRPPVSRVTAYDWLGEPRTLSMPCWQWVHEVTDAPLRLPHRLFFPFSPKDSDQDVLELTTDTDPLRLYRAENSREAGFAVGVPGVQGGAFTEFIGAASLPARVREGGFWIRSSGPPPRLLHVTLEKATQ